MDGHQPAADTPDMDIELGRAWRQHRRHLLDVGFRMLGNLADAEDVVQEAFARLVRADRARSTTWRTACRRRQSVVHRPLRSDRRHPTSSGA